MKILLIHNYYQQSGGEDRVFQAEKQLLIDSKHDVITYERNNQEIENYNSLKRISLVGNTIWSLDSQRKIERLLETHHPDIVHFHNTFPLISPSAYYSCHRYGAGIVQTLHNFRYLCMNALFYRDGHICEDCLGRTPPWPSIVHACYRNSRIQTAATSVMVTTHRVIRTFQKKVDQFIALSNFSREKFIQGGLPPEKIIVKPNFVYPDPGAKVGNGEYLLFVGRLSPEKGIMTLLRAILKNPEIPVRVVGDGPLLEAARKFVEREYLQHVMFLGRLGKEETIWQMKQARALVFPSECYENFPLVIVEAFACGLPVIATRLGGTQELVKDGRTGLQFEAAHSEELASHLVSLWLRPEQATMMGREARKEYETRYTATRNLELIMQVYQNVVNRRNT
jgi:glycosyltransferase involved in cell wall biosynthesis